MDQEKTLPIGKTRELEEKIGHILLRKNTLWVLSMINIDGLKSMNENLGYDSTNDKIEYTGQTINQFCNQLPNRMFAFKHDKNKFGKGNIFAVLFDFIIK